MMALAKLAATLAQRPPRVNTRYRGGRAAVLVPLAEESPGGRVVLWLTVRAATLRTSPGDVGKRAIAQEQIRDEIPREPHSRTRPSTRPRGRARDGRHKPSRAASETLRTNRTGPRRWCAPTCARCSVASVAVGGTDHPRTRAAAGRRSRAGGTSARPKRKLGWTRRR